jgi:hypothetical protein
MPRERPNDILRRKVPDIRQLRYPKKGGIAMSYLIDDIRRFETEGKAIEDLVALSAVGRVVQDEFAKLSVEEPEFLGPKLREIRREIQVRDADRIEKLIREKESRLEALKPAEQKRQELQADIDRLKAKQTQLGP